MYCMPPPDVLAVALAIRHLVDERFRPISTSCRNGAVAGVGRLGLDHGADRSPRLPASRRAALRGRTEGPRSRAGVRGRARAPLDRRMVRTGGVPGRALEGVR